MKKRTNEGLQRFKEYYRSKRENALGEFSDAAVEENPKDAFEKYKSKLIQTVKEAPVSMAAAALGGVLLENSMGKTPSFIFGAFATYMGYLTGLKPLSALGLGMVTSSYYSYRMEGRTNREIKDEDVSGILQSKEEHLRDNAPDSHLFSPDMDGLTESYISDWETEESIEEERYEKLPPINFKTVFKKRDVEDSDDDIESKLY